MENSSSLLIVDWKWMNILKNCTGFGKLQWAIMQRWKLLSVIQEFTKGSSIGSTHSKINFKKKRESRNGRFINDGNTVQLHSFLFFGHHQKFQKPTVPSRWKVFIANENKNKTPGDKQIFENHKKQNIIRKDDEK